MERSYLFVPGNQYERIGKALHSEADAVIIDLEDAVAVDHKKEARRIIKMALTDYDTTDKQIYLRINDMKTNEWQEDVKLANEFPQLGIFLPMAESREEILLLEDQLQGKRKIVPIIETAKGIMAVHSIALASRQVFRLAFGALDYCLDLGISITKEQHELIYPRSLLAVVSKTADIMSPIDTVYPEFHDDAGLKEEIQRARQLGFSAKLCIHPRQLPLVNEGFSHTEEEIRWAREVVETFQKAEKEGRAAINFKGTMIDYPVYKRALAILGEKDPSQTR